MLYSASAQDTENVSDPTYHMYINPRAYDRGERKAS